MLDITHADLVQHHCILLYAAQSTSSDRHNPRTAHLYLPAHRQNFLPAALAGRRQAAALALALDRAHRTPPCQQHTNCHAVHAGPLTVPG